MLVRVGHVGDVAPMVMDHYLGVGVRVIPHGDAIENTAPVYVTIAIVAHHRSTPPTRAVEVAGLAMPAAIPAISDLSELAQV